MGLDEKALGTAAAAIAYGMTGVLSMIPALQEIRLERKLNEDKTRLEKNGFHREESFTEDGVESGYYLRQ